MADAFRMARMLLVVAIAAIAAMKIVPLTDSSSAATSTRGQTLFGMNVPSLERLDDSESAVGARAAIVGTFADWAHTPDFPLALARDVNRRGAVLLVSWEPWDSDRGGAEQFRYALRRIVAGDHDALIDRWARQVAAYGRPVMLRFAPEMNGDWLPWSTGVNGNRRGDYVLAWRHVRERFRRAGASNAVWVWNPIAAYDGSTPLGELFPGAGQVDWLAVDGYNWGDTRAWGWQSYADILAPTVRTLGTLAPRRPVMIAETAQRARPPQGRLGGGHAPRRPCRRRRRARLVRVRQGDRLAARGRSRGRPSRRLRAARRRLAPGRRARRRRAPGPPMISVSRCPGFALSGAGPRSTPRWRRARQDQRRRARVRAA